MAKTSLDGHWRGIAVVTAALRDAGMEVVYGGQLTPKEILASAIHEDVDVVGLHIGGRYGSVKEFMDMLHQKGLGNVVVVAGGTIPPEDIPLLHRMGIAGVFPPGSELDKIASFIRERVRGQQGAK